MNLVLFDLPVNRTNLLPFTYTKPVAELRVGILTIREKWEQRLGFEASHLTESYLDLKYPPRVGEDNLFINAAVCPDDPLIDSVLNLDPETCLASSDRILAFRCSEKAAKSLTMESLENFVSGKIKTFDYGHPYLAIEKSWDIFKYNGSQIKEDFKLITRGRESKKVEDPFTRIYNSEAIFLEEGVSIKAAILNAENGPVYLGKNVQVHEGAIIKGPFGAGEGTQINIGAKIREEVSTGPHCRIGGEVKNTVFLGYCNKAHEGFAGNSVIGEWCNIGADTNTSNLKNTYASVKLWDFGANRFIDSGEQYCGLMMGDHSKAGINSMFNTGTVIGVGANLYGSGFHRNFIPSFAWGGPQGSFKTFKLEKFYELAQIVMERRGIEFDDKEKKIYKYLFDLTSQFRFWEG